MAKNLKVKLYDVPFNGIAAAQDFTPLRVQHQVGDKFYVPRMDMLLILGTAIPAMVRQPDGTFVDQKDEKGEIVNRTVGQHFPAVRLVNGQPAEVVELYVGQLVKVDINRKLVFPGDLATALRAGSDAFKTAICGKTLEITDEATCTDREWDSVNNRWNRNEETNEFIGRTSRALKFEPKGSTLSAKEIEAAEALLVDYINEQYADLVESK